MTWQLLGLDFEFLATDGGFVHQTALCLRENRHAAVEFGICGRASSHGNSRGLRIQLVVAPLEIFQRRGIFNEDELTVRLPRAGPA